MPNSVIPEGYEDREYSADAWRESVINNAVERALSDDKKGYAMPSWWDVNKPYNDCIYTALDNYSPAIGTPEVGINVFPGSGKMGHAAKGFQQLESGSTPQKGDLMLYYYDENTPQHMEIVTGVDENGVPLVSGTNGSGEYHRNSSKNHRYFTTNGNGTAAPYRSYRFVGTSEQLKQIEDYNSSLRARNLQNYGDERGIRSIKPSINAVTIEDPTSQRKRAEAAEKLNSLFRP